MTDLRFIPANHIRVQHNYTRNDFIHPRGGDSWQDFTGDLTQLLVNLREMPGTHTAALSFYRANMDPSQSSGTRVIKKGDIVRISAHNGSSKRRRMATFTVKTVKVDINLKAPVGRQNKVSVTLLGVGVAGVAGTG